MRRFVNPCWVVLMWITNLGLIIRAAPIINQQYSFQNLTPLNTIKTLQIMQMVDNQLFFLDKASNTFNNLQYVIFDIAFDQSTTQNIQNYMYNPPMLCYAFDKDPTLLLTNDSINLSQCNGFNFNQYSRQNGQYFLNIDVTSASFSTLKIVVFITGMQVQYSVNLRGQYSQNQPQLCPFNCQNSVSLQVGTCNKGQCICNSGYIDEDCSTSAQQINQKSIKLSVNNYQMVYAYYQPNQAVQDLSSVSDITISFQLLNSFPAIDTYISVQGIDPKKIVPTSQIYLMHYQIKQSNQALTLNANGQYDTNGNPIYTVLGFIINQQGGSQSNEIMISISNSSSDSTNTNLIIIYFLVGVVSLLFLIWIILTIIKIRYARRNQIIDVAMAQAQVNAAVQRVQQRRGQSTKLTIEIIDKFLPSYPFEDVKKRISEKGKSLNDACAVCLCEFEDTDVCRETICNHYFHKDCLEQWLKKQENCPFCRTDLTRASLIKHFEGAKIKSEDGNAASESHDNQSNQQRQNPLDNGVAAASNPSRINEASPLQIQQNGQSLQPSNFNLIRGSNDRNQQPLQNPQANGSAVSSGNQPERRQYNQLNIVQRNQSNASLNQQSNGQQQQQQQPQQRQQQQQAHPLSMINQNNLQVYNYQ